MEKAGDGAVLPVGTPCCLVSCRVQTCALTTLDSKDHERGIADLASLKP
jgi:hypothetical protein